MNSKVIINIPFVSVVSYRATGLPNRQLHLSFTFRNPHDKPITIIDAWLTISVNDTYDILTGRFLNVRKSQIEGKSEGYAELFIPLSPTVLDSIESRRDGGDVNFRFSSNVLLCLNDEKDGSLLLGEPMQSQFDRGNSGYFEYKIPQSEWVKLLSSLQWSELELIEMPLAKMRSVPVLQRAVSRYEEAQKQYRNGLWTQAVASCRSVFEALVKDITEQNEMSQGTVALVKILGEGPKTDSVDKLIKALTPLLHLARHQQQPPVEINSPEALIALRVTGSILAYICETAK